MGRIKKILENELVGGTQTTDVYPVTSVKAVYNENNERLDNIIKGIETDIEDLNTNTGISEHPAFDPAGDYVVGNVVNYEGRLYRFTAKHVAGKWIGTDVEKWSERKEVEGGLAELATKIISIPVIQSNLYNDIKSISVTPLSLPIVDKNGDVLTTRDTLGWMAVEKGKLYHVVGDVNLSIGQSVIVAWSESPLPDTYIDNYDSFLAAGSYHIDTIIESKGVRLTTSNGLSVYECEKKTDTIEKRIEDLLDEVDKTILLFEQTYTKSGSNPKFLLVHQDLVEGTGYRLTLSNVIANSKIRIFSAALNNVGFNDSEQYFYDIEPTDGVYYLYCNTNAEWLYIQVIESIDTTVNFTAKLETSNLITEVAKQSYLRRNEKPIFTNNSIKIITEQGFKLGNIINLNQVNVSGVEDGGIRPSCNRQWGKITPNTDYYISGIANIEKGENIITLFNGAANINTFINDFDSYVRKGVYDVSFAFNSGEATRVSIPHGINLVPIYGIKEQVSLNKTIIDHLVTPTDKQSDSWRGVFSLIPKGSKITECSYMPMAVGSSICAIWKYDDDAKTMQKMEEFIVQSNEVGVKTNISELQNRVLEYDAFIMFKKDGNNNTAIGWTNDGTNSLLAFSASLGDSFSARDNTLSGSVGHLCVKISYESNYYRYNTSVIEVGKGMAFESLSLAALAASYGDTIIVHKGLYKNNNIQSFGKKIHIVGIDKYSCILECDTSDYLNPPIEMNIGSISNMTIIETCENPTVTDKDKFQADIDRLNMAYCIHSESSVMAAGEVLNIDNCILKNKHRPCLGAGLYQDYSIIMKNTQCHSGMGYINTVSGRNGCRGALYFHTKADDSNTTGQIFYAENCVFECDDNKYATINGYYNNTMEVTFIGNTFWSGIIGKSEEGLSHNVGIGGDSIISLSGKSNGNNVSLLNHK